jgi:hypothetical protein
MDHFPAGKLNKQNVSASATDLLLDALGGQEAAAKESVSTTLETRNLSVLHTFFFLLLQTFTSSFPMLQSPCTHYSSGY